MNRRRGVLAHLAIMVCAALGLMFQPRAAIAHEIGTTRISLVLLAADRYELEITTDAAALLEKVGAAGATTTAVPADLAVLRDRLQLSEEVFLRRVEITFDSSPVRPAIAWTILPGASGGAPIATVHLRGTVPPGAKSASCSYGWTFTRYAFSVRHGSDGNAVTEWLDGDQASTPVSLADNSTDRSGIGILGKYVALGFTHILPKGIDHVLFVLGVFLLSRKARPVLLQISAFTIAHSITLGLSIYGVVTLPPAVVEPAIALSIAYIALENIFMKDLKPWRYALVFLFGLLHGLGFAGALSEIGLPREDFLLALLGFNAGVELGQLTVIALAFAGVGYWFRERVWYRQRIVLPASLCIALFGLYWTVQRLGLA